ncbi:unnamed protein product [Callosobruchus maculatus]|nr:unnamed protein product [Callosobruchus maculatus]
MVSYVRRQAYIIKEILKKTKTVQQKYTSKTYDDTNQRRTREFLILAIKNHQALVRATSSLTDEMGTIIYVLFMVSILFFAVMFCLALQKMTFISFIPVLTLNLYLLFYTSVGQSWVDETQEIFTTACFTPWRFFNKSNISLLLVLMENTRNGQRIKKANLSLDRRGFTSQFNIVASTGLTLYQAFQRAGQY